VSVTVTVHHDGGSFVRQYRISRHADSQDETVNSWDQRHTYLIEQSGGGKTPRALFEHRFGDPLHALIAEGLAALSKEPNCDRAVFAEPILDVEEPPC